MLSHLHHQSITTISLPSHLQPLLTLSLWFIFQSEFYPDRFVEIVARVLQLMVLAALIHAQLELFHSLIRMDQLDAKSAQPNLDSFFQEINASLEQPPPQLSQPLELSYPRKKNQLLLYL